MQYQSAIGTICNHVWQPKILKNSLDLVLMCKLTKIKFLVILKIGKIRLRTLRCWRNRICILATSEDRMKFIFCWTRYMVYVCRLFDMSSIQSEMNFSRAKHATGYSAFQLGWPTKYVFPILCNSLAICNFEWINTSERIVNAFFAQYNLFQILYRREFAEIILIKQGTIWTVTKTTWPLIEYILLLCSIYISLNEITYGGAGFENSCKHVIVCVCICIRHTRRVDKENTEWTLNTGQRRKNSM